MANATVSLTTATSTSPGASAPIVLTWRAGYQPATVSVYGSVATSSGAVVVQYTLDDLQIVGGSSLANWSGVSSAIGQPATVFNSTTSFPDGVLVTFTYPVAAVRMNSSALNGGTWTMKVLQGG